MPKCNPTLIIFSAEVGGWLGLILGASIISLGELLYFAFLFIKIMILKINALVSNSNRIMNINDAT
jgi:hypothetical protein